MELTKKTTILFPPPLWEHLTRVAGRRGVSVGELVREACYECYGTPTTNEREDAVEELARMQLPVGTVSKMKKESVPSPKRIHP